MGQNQQSTNIFGWSGLSVESRVLEKTIQLEGFLLGNDTSSTVLKMMLDLTRVAKHRVNVTLTALEAVTSVHVRELLTGMIRARQVEKDAILGSGNEKGVFLRTTCAAPPYTHMTPSMLVVGYLVVRDTEFESGSKIVNERFEKSKTGVYHVKYAILAVARHTSSVLLITADLHCQLADCFISHQSLIDSPPSSSGFIIYVTRALPHAPITRQIRSSCN
ncbi:hypothetical protein J6590_006418 [Homalodisca vitripennis]|nr:hypothetical protein J6590_006418 [Homalodisca vitripennis]